MKPEHAASSLRASAVSMILRLKELKDGYATEGTPEIRLAIADGINKIIDSIKPDETGWEHFKGKMFYDVYLLQREEEGTLSDYDLIRGGLVSAQFADSTAYHQHCIRVSESRKGKSVDQVTEKLCVGCGEVKSINKFKFRGGAKCNACRSREYRERKNAS